MFTIRRKRKIDELERIIEEYQDALFSFAFFRVGSFEIAQDIVQDAFLLLYQKGTSLNNVANVKS